MRSRDRTRREMGSILREERSDCGVNRERSCKEVSVLNISVVVKGGTMTKTTEWGPTGCRVRWDTGAIAVVSRQGESRLEKGNHGLGGQVNSMGKKGRRKWVFHSVFTGEGRVLLHAELDFKCKRADEEEAWRTPKESAARACHRVR